MCAPMYGFAIIRQRLLTSANYIQHSDGGGSRRSTNNTQAPPSVAEALQFSLALSQQLGSLADKHDEVSHPDDAVEFPPNTTVKAVFDSGGDEADNIPAFRRGDKFVVITQHDGGWLEVAEGFLLTSWVTVVSRDPAPAPTPARASEARTSTYDDSPQIYVIARGTNKLGLQIAGGSADHPEIFVKKVALPARAHRRSTTAGLLIWTAACRRATASSLWMASALMDCRMPRLWKP